MKIHVLSVNIYRVAHFRDDDDVYSNTPGKNNSFNTPCQWIIVDHMAFLLQINSWPMRSQNMRLANVIWQI